MPLLPRKRFWGILWGIAIAGLILRLIVSFQLKSYDPSVTAPPAISDMATYVKLAEDILKGILPPTFYYQPFYYSFFLPIARFFGGETGLILFQSLLGAGIIFLAGKNTFYVTGNKYGALAAGGLCAFSAILIYFTPYALIELLQAFLILLTFDLFFTALRRHSFKYYFFAGLVWGASILTRGNTLLYLPLFLLFVLFREGEGIKVFFRKKRFYFSFLLLLAGMLLIQMPYTGYNSWKLKRVSGPSTAGPSVLALGNNKEAAPAGLEVPYPPSFHALMRKEKEPGGVVGGILAWAKEEPAAFLEHKAKQFFLFWDGRDYPNNISEEYNAAKSPLMASCRFLPTSILLLLALAGFFQAVRKKTLFRRKGMLLLWGMILIYAFSTALFYILARFRLPILPLIAMAGGGFLGFLFRKQEKGELFRNVIYLAGGIFFVFLLYPLYVFTYEPLLMQSIRPFGVRNQVFSREVPGLANAAGTEKERSYEMLLDSSSIAQGTFRELPLQEGMKIVKSFHISPKAPFPKGDKGLLVIPVSAQGPSSLVLEHAGGRLFFQPKKELDYLVIKDIPLIREASGEGEKITLDFVVTHLTGQVSFFLDGARDYGRSLLRPPGKSEPEKTNMEFVLRLLLPCGDD